jgi:hypothetical protein
LLVGNQLTTASTTESHRRPTARIARSSIRIVAAIIDAQTAAIAHNTDDSDDPFGERHEQNDDGAVEYYDAPDDDGTTRDDR